ncbi:MAG: IS3 family transposase [Pseudomonadota bacterium]
MIQAARTALTRLTDLKHATHYEKAGRFIFFAMTHGIVAYITRSCPFQNVAEAEQYLFNYIEIYYNRQRKHSTNGYKSPAQYELEWWNNRKAA